jgi:hypothetical protein
MVEDMDEAPWKRRGDETGFAALINSIAVAGLLPIEEG